MAEDGGPLDDVSQFAYISGPGIPAKQVKRFLGEVPRGAVMVFPEKGKKPLCKMDDIVRSLTERRYLDLDHVQSVVQVLPEPVIPDGFLHVHVRGGDQSDIGLAGYVIAQSLVFPFLDEPQELGLDGQG